MLSHYDKNIKMADLSDLKTKEVRVHLNHIVVMYRSSKALELHSMIQDLHKGSCVYCKRSCQRYSRGDVYCP